ncbi:MAG TPA: sensor histidine kinase [Ruminococcaceae bacterium]|nr:sensor histidine kinase [Oscillospiraceae bacterium]
MIKALQKRFVTTAMAAISILLILMLGAINIINIITTSKRSDETLRIVSMSEGNPKIFDKPNQKPPQEPQPKPTRSESFLGENKNEYDIFMSSNFFIVRFDNDMNAVFTDTERTSTVTDKQAVSLAEQAVAEQSRQGRFGKYRFFCDIGNESQETVVVFLDVTNDIRSCLSVLIASLAVGIVCWIFMLLITAFLSRKAIRPIAENMEKQKQFVTNAGHEIKTPLAIIQSNTEAMELYSGESKWSKNIKTQVERLSGLTQSLLTLARMDEGAEKTLTTIDISELLIQTAEQFQDAAEQKGIALTTSIQPDIRIQAVRTEAEQLCGILLDNAVKYTDDNGCIEIDLQKKDKALLMTVQNTCSALPQTEPQKLFDRFYRSDKARTQQSGGYGIGLSVAQGIVESYGGTIRADYPEPNRICFTVKLKV